MIQKASYDQRELSIKIDLRNKKPVTEQIETEIRVIIEQGILSPGDQLPTVRQLASQLRVNFNTVARAYRILDQLGYITMRQGRGTFVTETGMEESEEAIPSPTASTVTFDEESVLDATTKNEPKVFDKLTERQSRRKQKRLEQMVSQLIEQTKRMNISIDEVIEAVKTQHELSAKKRVIKVKQTSIRKLRQHTFRLKKFPPSAPNKAE